MFSRIRQFRHLEDFPLLAKRKTNAASHTSIRRRGRRRRISSLRDEGWVPVDRSPSWSRAGRPAPVCAGAARLAGLLALVAGGLLLQRSSGSRRHWWVAAPPPTRRASNERLLARLVRFVGSGAAPPLLAAGSRGERTGRGFAAGGDGGGRR
ncbi:hypothetical protein PVAP13_8NG067102 [Panicum virgatum]|uniref:Uncharacterized protein n=1 Tax=Panicum virgatum TaxID=38727 RepID=A0A8T0P7E1_PANVG|nr:hypothetical protein PVAP13_8NG067102 [Panicum virgatum]